MSESRPGEERGIQIIEAPKKSAVVVQVPHEEIDSCLDRG